MFDITEGLTQSEHLVVIRRLQAPVSRVYEAWTDPLILSRWFAPNVRWKHVSARTDVRVGGQYSISMHHIDGDVYTLSGTYLEVLPHRRLRFTFKWDPGMVDSEPSSVTLDFAGIGNETELRIKHVNIAEPERAETRRGWEGCLDLLESLVVVGTTHLDSNSSLAASGR